MLGASWTVTVTTNWRISNIAVQEILLSESSESSDEEHDPITEDDFKDMLRLHKEQKLCRRKYLLDKNVRNIFIFPNGPIA
jgi:hypothetical protein